MAINLNELDKRGISSWGPVTSLRLQSLAKEIAEMNTDQLQNVDLSDLKEVIASFEKIREKAKELNLRVYGNPL